MTIKAIEKKIANLNYIKTQETRHFIQYERVEPLCHRKHIVTLEHKDNCVYHITSYALYDTTSDRDYEGLGLTWEANYLFNKRLKKMIKANLKEGIY